MILKGQVSQHNFGAAAVSFFQSIALRWKSITVTLNDEHFKKLQFAMNEKLCQKQRVFNIFEGFDDTQITCGNAIIINLKY